MLTEQKIFDTAYTRHVIERQPLGFYQADTGAIRCSYKYGCFIGCNLTQEVLEIIDENGGEGTNIIWLRSQVPEIDRILPSNNEFLDIGQMAHDNTARDYGTAEEDVRVEAIRENYMYVARQFNLTIPD